MAILPNSMDKDGIDSKLLHLTPKKRKEAGGEGLALTGRAKRSLATALELTKKNLYTCIARLEGEYRVACWESCLRHMCNQHIFPENKLFPKCKHVKSDDVQSDENKFYGPPTMDGDISKKPWLRES